MRWKIAHMCAADAADAAVAASLPRTCDTLSCTCTCTCPAIVAACALTPCPLRHRRYVEAFTLRRSALDTLLEENVFAARVIHKAARRVTLQRSLLRFLTQQSGKRGPCSFVLKSMARGVEFVDDKKSLEQKVDATGAKCALRSRRTDRR